MARPQSRYVCQSCGATAPRWEGRCHVCGTWDSLVETLVREPSRGTGGPRRGRPGQGPEASPVPLSALAPQPIVRVASGVAELDRVLGGGLVPGSLVLLGGEPGIGKSTLVLEAAGGVARAGGATGSVLYASGEESPAQLRLRAERLGLLDAGAATADAVRILAETDVERIVEAAVDLGPRLLIVDSIQTVAHDALEGPPGSVGQVRESAARLLSFAKGSGVPVVLVGHVTKEGGLAGPKTLEHLVDAVLTLEGERFVGLRLLRASKNRFGSTEELGVFEMAGDGLREVPDPTRAFLHGGNEAEPGSAIAALLEGSRPLLAEVQALVAPSGAFGAPRRAVSGLDANRLALLIAVLGRRAGLRLSDRDVYASLAGGLTSGEPAIDLPLALALASSYRDVPVRRGTVAVGEVGLLGELRPAPGIGRRLREAARLGFQRAIVPAGSQGSATGQPRELQEEAIPGLEIVPVRTLAEALQAGLEGAVERSS